MKKIIISEEFNPYFNIAAEHQLFLDSEEEIHLFLWQNEDCVIIGRNQNLYAECNLAYLKEKNIKAVRRFSGGGAVYQDRGNINFTFITKDQSANQVQFIKLIQSAMLKLGIDCELSGRNDLLYKNQKFSGHAYYTDSNNFMYHGTMLVRVNLEHLGKVLTPSPLKLHSKGIESVKNRVINLSDINAAITIEKVSQAFIEIFECENIEHINETNFEAPLKTLLASDEWLYAQSPDYDVELERKFSIGNVTVHICVAKDFIQKVKINTDSLHLYDFKACEDNLIGKHFCEQMIWESISQYFEKNS
ncbi:lipoate--protein ligase [Lachnotalea glycerini]|uniref:lipoate--protein ligase n=1 Tax=Lachnotalea glycerini TaxID=1763509 RepID=A0A371JDA6_9FIRM|nr:lipoate--protein ligase [Lachnotalea glycerini]RDY30666.1 lipoate--protein ligase [Lachnotalea glycerini]